MSIGSCFLLTIVVIIASLPFLSAFVERIHANRFERERGTILQALEKEKNFLAAETESIVAQGILNRYIKEADVLQIVSLLSQERDARGIGGLLVTNGEGMVLSRTQAIERRGDYIYQLSSWGRVLERGESVASIEQGIVWPMLIVAAQNIFEEEGRIGSLVTIFVTNDAYARSFRDGNLSPDAQVAFYTKEKGIVGHSFGSIHIGELLATHFNSGSDFVRQGESGKRVYIEDHPYFMLNVPLADVEGEEFGGVLVFLEYSTLFQHLAAVLLTLLLLVPVLAYICARARLPWMERVILIAAFGVAAGGTVFFVNSRLIDMRALVLTDPAYLIYNATMRFDPEYATIERGLSHRASIQVFIGGETINAVQAIVHFDPERVRVEDILTTGSMCPPDLFIERSIDNENGEVRIVCGVPAPGFRGLQGIVAELILSPLQDGEFELLFSEETQVLAHDGLGTNVLRATTDAAFQVTASRGEAETAGDNAQDTFVFSPTHPNASRWYNARTARFVWSDGLGEEVEYWYAFDQDPNTVPDGGMRTSERTAVFPIESDGVRYFHVAAVRDGHMGRVVHRRIMADITPPSPPVIRASQEVVTPGEIVRLEFRGEDAGNGLQQTFYVRFRNGMLLPVGSQLYTTFMEKGVHDITLRTFDHAENYSESSISINVR